MPSTFTFKPTVGARGEVKHRTRSSQFGDGYVQTVGDGINTKIQSWSLSFVGKTAALTPVKDFLDGLQGHTSFNWTPPLGITGLYLADEYQITDMGADVFQLDVTFKEVFAP